MQTKDTRHKISNLFGLMEPKEAVRLVRSMFKIEKNVILGLAAEVVFIAILMFIVFALAILLINFHRL